MDQNKSQGMGQDHSQGGVSGAFSFFFFRNFKVGTKLSFIPLLFILTVIGIVMNFNDFLKEQSENAFITKSLGRQRLLVQQFQSEMMLLIHGAKTSEDHLRYLRKIVEETHMAFLKGGSILENTGQLSRRTVDIISDKNFLEELSRDENLTQKFFSLGEDILKEGIKDPNLITKLRIFNNHNNLLDDSMRSTVNNYISMTENNIHSFIRSSVMIATAVSIIGLFLGLLLSREITHRLSEVVKLAIEIAKGNLRYQKISINSKDELGVLAHVFNDMLDSLRDMASQSILVAKNLGSASSQVLASIQQQAAATKQQAASVQETTTTMEEIGQAGAQISDKAKQVVSSAELTANFVKSGVQAVQGSHQTMISIRDQVEILAQNMVKLSERNQAIGEIVSTVNEVAEQSHLLSLNAAIEAAGAGEQGKRFSVVAIELKSLADQAKDSTNQVRSILSDIQKGIGHSVMLTEEAVKRVENGKILSDTAEQTIQQLSKTTESSVKAFQQIVGATNQQQIGFEQITQALKAIRQGTEQTALSTNELEKAAMSLNSLGQQLQQSSERYQI